jgi:hypothetical protein
MERWRNPRAGRGLPRSSRPDALRGSGSVAAEIDRGFACGLGAEVARQAPLDLQRLRYACDVCGRPSRGLRLHETAPWRAHERSVWS